MGRVLTSYNITENEFLLSRIILFLIYAGVYNIITVFIIFYRVVYTCTNNNMFWFSRIVRAKTF